MNIKIIGRASAPAFLLIAALFGWNSVQAGENEAKTDADAPSRQQDDPAAQAHDEDMEAAIYETWKKLLPKMKKETAPRAGAYTDVPEPTQIEGTQHIPTLTGDPANPIAVMSSKNPMVNATCRAEVEDLHRKSYARLKNIGDEEAAQEIRRHYEELRAMLEKKSTLTPGEVFRHVASCKEFCFPREVFLTSCHVNAVAHSERRELVLFGFNQDEVPARYLDTIRSVADQVNTEADDKILLVGRASYPGADDYNVALSQRRTASVIDLLRDHDVAVDRITSMTIGEYAPKLGNTMLSMYGLAGVTSGINASSEEERMQKLNQSVLLVVYAGHDAMAPHTDDIAAVPVKGG